MARRKTPARRRGISPISGTPIPDPKGANLLGVAKEPTGEPASPEEITRLAQLYAPEAIRTLRAIMRYTKAPSSSRVSAALGVLDRAYGKVTAAQQPVTKGAESQRDLDQLSDAELAAALKILTNRKSHPRGDEAPAH